MQVADFREALLTDPDVTLSLDAGKAIVQVGTPQLPDYACVCIGIVVIHTNNPWLIALGGGCCMQTAPTVSRLQGTKSARRGGQG